MIIDIKKLFKCIFTDKNLQILVKKICSQYNNNNNRNKDKNNKIIDTIKYRNKPGKSINSYTYKFS